jgi:hypothetical protein
VAASNQRSRQHLELVVLQIQQLQLLQETHLLWQVCEPVVAHTQLLKLRQLREQLGRQDLQLVA